MEETQNQPRVAIVTGAARGIGAATAQTLAETGITIAVLDLSAEACEETVEAITAAGGSAAGFAVDVTDETAVSAAVAAVNDQLGPPTILINNAGITRDNLLFKMTLEDWDAVMSVHLRGAFLMSRAVQPHMTEASFGRIVNLSSTSALGNRGQANYAAAKAGMQGFTKTLAIELGRFGVTVNAIAPGMVETDMTHATAQRLRLTFEEFEAKITEQLAIKRIGQPEDVANLAAFLVSEGAGYISGQVIYVAGGPVD